MAELKQETSLVQNLEDFRLETYKFGVEWTTAWTTAYVKLALAND